MSPTSAMIAAAGIELMPGTVWIMWQYSHPRQPGISCDCNFSIPSWIALFNVKYLAPYGFDLFEGQLQLQSECI